MGWQSECGTHEGYLVGLVFDDARGVFSGHAGYPRDEDENHSGRMRELGIHGDDQIRDRHPLAFVKMACACGWRSPLLRAPRGSFWAPSAAFAPEAFEEECRKLWEHHVRVTGPALDGGCSIHELTTRASEAPRGIR